MLVSQEVGSLLLSLYLEVAKSMIQNRIHIIIIIDHLVAANYTPTANLSSQLPAGSIMVSPSFHFYSKA